MKKVISILFTIILTLSTYFEASAAGILLTSDNSSNWKLIAPQAQSSYINYSNNIQKTILDISFAENIDSNSTFWIVPVPGTKKDINVDSIKSSPYLHGQYLDEQYKSKINWWHTLLLSSQIYTFPLIMTTGSGTRMGLFGTLPIIRDDIYQVNTNIININELNNFMVTNKIDISPLLLRSIGNYNSNHALIISHITVPEKLRNSHVPKNSKYYHLNMYVKFKTDKIFYPLKISNIYEKNIIPIEIFVINPYEANLNDIIDRKSENYHGGEGNTSYHSLSYIDFKDDFKDFFDQQSYKRLYYSKFSIEAESKDFINDLSIEDIKSEKIKTMIFINDYIYLIYLSIYFIASCVSSFISTRFCYMESPPSFFKTLQLGLLNFITLIGVYFFAPSIINDKNGKSIIPYMILFSIIFITLTEIASTIVLNQLLIK